jgi:hypothetical protein
MGGAHRTTITEFCTSAQTREWVTEPIATALYVSAGVDPRALTFTHPDFMAVRGAADVPAPNVFVYLDKRPRPAEDDVPIAFGTAADPTQIQTERMVRAEIDGCPAYVLDVRWTSTRLSDRNLRVLRIKASNRLAAQVVAPERWLPDVFIGVCDGCGGLRGNARCENDLKAWPLGAGQTLPRWWITDHLTNAGLAHVAMPEDGEVILGPTPRFPYRVRQQSVVSPVWRGPCWGAATRLEGGARVLEVVPAG